MTGSDDDDAKEPVHLSIVKLTCLDALAGTDVRGLHSLQRRKSSLGIARR